MTIVLVQCASCGRTIARGRGVPPPGVVSHRANGKCEPCHKRPDASHPHGAPRRLTGPDLAYEIHHFAGFGWQPRHIADRLGISVSCVEKHLRKGAA